MFKFNDLSKTEPMEEDVFKMDDYRLSFSTFLEKRQTEMRPYVFDLRTQEEFEAGHLPNAYSLPIEHFENSIYQMPYEGLIMLYGSGSEEAAQAAEILYENGFENFGFIESYQDLLKFLSQAEFTITEPAQAHIRQKLEAEAALKSLKIVAKAISTKKAKFSVAFVSEDDELPQGLTLEKEGIPVYVDAESLLYLEGTVVDYDESTEEGLTIKNEEREVPPLTGNEREIMEQLLEEQINPMVASHGGVVELIDIKDDRVYLEFGGGCKGCGMVNVTLKQGVEVIIKEQIPGINEILDVTEHADGTNPYYQPSK